VGKKPLSYFRKERMGCHHHGHKGGGGRSLLHVRGRRRDTIYLQRGGEVLPFPGKRGEVSITTIDLGGGGGSLNLLFNSRGGKGEKERRALA